MNRSKRWMKFMGVGLAGVMLLGLGAACSVSVITDDDTTGGNGSGAIETVEKRVSVGPNLAGLCGTPTANLSGGGRFVLLRLY